ncbi:MAG: hypothetical protein ACLGHP_10155, partial [Vicinamibacteria bacterium]
EALRRVYAGALQADAAAAVGDGSDGPGVSNGSMVRPPRAPTKAIDAANAAGGPDNITVVLFRLEDVRGADEGAEQPTSSGAPGDPTSADVRAALADGATATATRPARAPSEPRRLEPSAPPSVAVRRDERRARRGRRWGAAFAVLALVALPLGFGAYSANQAVFFIGTNDDGFVTLYRGLPYTLPAGIDLFRPTYVSGVPLQTLSPARRARIVDHRLRSHDDASDLVRELELGRVAS